MFECVLDSNDLFVLKFAIFHREILINPRISSIHRWISLINIVKSLDFSVKSLVFALLLTVLAFFCFYWDQMHCRIGVERSNCFIYLFCFFHDKLFERQSSINPLRNPGKSSDFFSIFVDFNKSLDFLEICEFLIWNPQYLFMFFGLFYSPLLSVTNAFCFQW